MKAIYKIGDTYVDVSKISSIKCGVDIVNLNATVIINNENVRFRMFIDETDYARYDTLTSKVMSMTFARKHDSVELKEAENESWRIRRLFIEKANKDIEMLINYWTLFVESKTVSKTEYIRDH